MDIRPHGCPSVPRQASKEKGKDPCRRGKGSTSLTWYARSRVATFISPFEYARGPPAAEAGSGLGGVNAVSLQLVLMVPTTSPQNKMLNSFFSNGEHIQSKNCTDTIATRANTIPHPLPAGGQETSSRRRHPRQPFREGRQGYAAGGEFFRGTLPTWFSLIMLITLERPANLACQSFSRNPAEGCGEMADTKVPHLFKTQLASARLPATGVRPVFVLNTCGTPGEVRMENFALCFDSFFPGKNTFHRVGVAWSVET